MNGKLQRILLSVLLVWTATYAWSQTAMKYYDAYVDGIYYALNKESMTAAVTLKEMKVLHIMDPHNPVMITYISDYKGDVVIPETIMVEGKEYRVTSIVSHAFHECNGLQSVSIPATVTSIGSYAFYGCTRLNSVNLPAKLRTVQGSVFEGCSALTSVGMPFTVDSIGEKAFYGCKNVKLIFPKVVKLGKDALTNSKISVGVEAYGLCFVPDKEEGTAMLIAKDIDVDENGNIIYNKDAKYEGKIALGGGYSINGNTESYRLTSIGDNAFTNCSLDGLYLRPSITTVYPAAFEDAQINSMFISSPLQSSYVAFTSLNGERIFTIPDEMEKIEQYFSGEVFSIEPVVTDVTPYLRGVSFRAQSANKYMTLGDPVGVEGIGPMEKGDDGYYMFKLDYLQPGEGSGLWLYYTIENCPDELSYVIQFTTLPFYSTTQLKSRTQTSISFTVTVPEDKTWSLKKLIIGEKEIENGGEVSYSGLTPGVSLSINGIALYDSTDFSSFWIDEINASFPFSISSIGTLGLDENISLQDIGPTSATLMGTYTLIDADVERTELICNEEVSENDRLDLTGLEPGEKYSIRYHIYLSNGNSVSDYREFTTDTVSFTTLPAQAVSNTCAIIAAECNISENEEGCGFEWRRYDAPDLVPSTFSPSFVANGVLAGRLEGLSSNTYYKYRPYYRSASGTYYYGEWMAFGTADAYVYFEPIVYTTEPVVEGSTVLLRGHMLAGSEAVVQQGFEYWEESVQSAPSKRSAGEVQVVFCSGQSMEATLEGLKQGTLYACRAFVTTARGTTYGSTQQFRTPALTAIEETAAAFGEERLRFSVRHAGQWEISVASPVQGSCTYRIVSAAGATVASGTVPGDGQWYPLKMDGEWMPGLYIVVVSDGTTTCSDKVLVN